jgi:signal transduction histidine kinase
MRFKPSAGSDIDLLPTTRIFKTESFRLAALFATSLLALSWILLGVVYWIVNDTETAALVGAIDSDVATILNGYRDEGLPEAIEVVQQRLGSGAHSIANATAGYFLIQDQHSDRLAGNLDALAPRLGLFSLRTSVTGTPVTVLGRGRYISDGVYLFVGRDTGGIVATKRRILIAFIWIAGASVLIAGVGGTLFGIRFMARTDAIAQTCEAFITGKFNDRVPVRGSGDELDRLATAVNTMLDRISALVDNLRQVSSDIAHDLRTPLTRLRHRLENARLKSVTPSDYAAAVTLAIDDTDRLLAIFGALLRISQIESGSRLATFADVPLSDLLAKMFDMYRPVAEDHHQALQSDIRAKITIRGDAELLTQLFSNLIENAIRHTPPRSIISIGLTIVDNSPVACIADSGPGIPAAERDKVLRRFYRLTSSRSTPGNGLGLALAAAIANLHQARLDLTDNAPGLRVRLSF